MSVQNILVKTPITTNGSNPVLDGKGQMQYTESILTIAAKPILEKRNQSLPQHLKVIIENIDEVAPEDIPQTVKTVKKP